MADGTDGTGRPKTKLIAAGYAVLGAGYLWEYFLRDLLESRSAALAYADPKGRRPGKAGDVINTSRTVTVRSIDERVSYIRDRVLKGSLSPKIREITASVLTRRCAGEWCVPEKDYLAEIKALFQSLKDPRNSWALRYTRDHIEVDQFFSAENLIRLNAGDCDDGTILLGSMLRNVGYPLKMRVIQSEGSKSWSHIFLRVGVPPAAPTRWIPLDWSVNRPAGWEAPGAEEALRTGRPHGMVTRTRDFDV